MAKADDPLWKALWSKSLEKVKRALTKGASVKKLSGGHTPLSYAAAFLEADIVQALLDAGADVNEGRKHDQATPLILAVQSRNLSKVRALIAAGADVNRETKAQTALFAACTVTTGHPSLEVVQALIDAGGNVNAVDYHTTVLMHASEKALPDIPDILKALVKAGADVNTKTKKGTALTCAIEADHATNVKTLLELGADPRLKGKDQTPIELAVELEHEEIVGILEAVGAEKAPSPPPKRPAPSPQTKQLFDAIMWNKVDEIKQLIANGAPVNEPDKEGYYLLHEAARWNRVEVIKLLVGAGADVNCTYAPTRTTPLKKAAYEGHLDTVKALMECGADVSLNEPLDSAIDAHSMGKKNSMKIIQTLIAAGADVNGGTEHVSILMAASGSGTSAIVQALIEAGADVNAARRRGTALTQAIEEGKADNVATLLEAGANPAFVFPKDCPQESKAGKSALDLARERKNKKIIALLESAPGNKRTKPKPGKMPTIAESWKRIESWLREHNKSLKSSLQKGATAKQLTGLESKIGAKLPPDFKEAYVVHNGQKEGGGELVSPLNEGDAGYFLITITGIVAEWNNWKRLVDIGEFKDQQGSPDKGIRDAWWHPGWVPFASNGGGDLLCIDLAPAKGGAVGQVITMNHESAERELLAPSFAHWLAELAENLEEEEGKG
jgi:ankyrin repeat protein/cell wall assembly regulator SMI1